jgi:hypothetical protein
MVDLDRLSACCGCIGVIHRFWDWKAGLELNPADCKGKLTVAVFCFWAIEFFLEAGAEGVSGEWASSVLLTDSGGEPRLVPRRIWQVGHSLTNLDMSSFGTLSLDVSTLARMGRTKHVHTMSTHAEPVQMSYLDLHVDIVYELE